MKIETKQKNAKQWNKTLNRINEAQVGEIAITYVDEENKKRVGYLSLHKIEFILGDKTITLGELLVEHEKKLNDDLEQAKEDVEFLKRKIVECEKHISLLSEFIIAEAERGIEDEKDVTF